MEKKIESPTVSVIGFAITTLLLSICQVSMAEKRSIYIVRMDISQMPTSATEHTEWYASSLKSLSQKANIIYNYTQVFTGCAVSLTKEEAQKLEARSEVFSVSPDLTYELHTTRTPLFLGLHRIPANNPAIKYASNVVVGVVDTGVWPESPSLNDIGMPEIPKLWKGKCQTGTNFNQSMCNRKLIGARFFLKGYEESRGPIMAAMESRSPRDDNQGHGTHTITTAAGSAVSGASLFSYANGTASGMAPSARLAVYKGCWGNYCSGADILAAMDKAIEDNVDVLSLSLGGSEIDYYRSGFAIGAFNAMGKGIFVSCSAGNAGPTAATLSNQAPWITTVGAGTLDRDFSAYVKLGNGKTYKGTSLSEETSFSEKHYPLVYAANVSYNANNGRFCINGTLINLKVNGKIVLCDRGVNTRVEKGAVVNAAGGAGMILANTALEGESVVADAHFLPAVAVGAKEANQIMKYLSSYGNPNAVIKFGRTTVGVQPSPVVAGFSSRGPNSITPEILKPDLIAPGVSILAGWSGSVGPTEEAYDTRRVKFNIASGTSMSCPHVSGLAALLKAGHPEWSPAAIRSALMTTAYSTYPNGKPMLDGFSGKAATPFDYGAGHVDPVAALDPGLIYDLTKTDYLDFLCAINYTTNQIKTLVGKTNFSCHLKKKYSVNDLNYPSFAISLQAQDDSKEVVHTRTLTNVADLAGTYKVSISSPRSVNISVVPQTLSFYQINEKKSYKVTFKFDPNTSNTDDFGRIEWSDGKHIVGSPIAINWMYKKKRENG